MTNEHIAFESMDDMPTPEVMITTKPEPIPQPEALDIEEEEAEKDIQPIPASIPRLLYKTVSKIIGCQKFELDKEESEVIADALNILFGGAAPRLVAVLSVLGITLEKIATCREAIRDRIRKIPKMTPQPEELIS